jgi:hypothetical protein
VGKNIVEDVLIDGGASVNTIDKREEDRWLKPPNKVRFT